jgi:hypothetical protein
MVKEIPMISKVCASEGAADVGCEDSFEFCGDAEDGGEYSEST